MHYGKNDKGLLKEFVYCNKAVPAKFIPMIERIVLAGALLGTCVCLNVRADDKKTSATTITGGTGPNRPPAEIREGGPVREPNFAYFGQSELEGVNYSFVTEWVVFKVTPNWNESDDFPPLSARKAASVALVEVKRLRPDVSNWTLESVTLSQITRHWFYKVRYWRSDKVGSGIPSFLDVPVLMDGTAVHGAVSPQ